MISHYKKVFATDSIVACVSKPIDGEYLQLGESIAEINRFASLRGNFSAIDYTEIIVNIQFLKINVNYYSIF